MSVSNLRSIEETLDVALNLRRAMADLMGATNDVLKSGDETMYNHHMREITSLVQLLQSPQHLSMLVGRNIPQNSTAPEATANMPQTIVSSIMSGADFDWVTLFENVCISVETMNPIPVPNLVLVDKRAKSFVDAMSFFPGVTTPPSRPSDIRVDLKSFVLHFEFGAPMNANGYTHFPLKEIHVTEGLICPPGLTHPAVKVAIQTMLYSMLAERISKTSVNDPKYEEACASALFNLLKRLVRLPNFVDMPCSFCGLYVRVLSSTSCPLPVLAWTFQVDAAADAKAATKDTYQAHLDCLCENHNIHNFN